VATKNHERDQPSDRNPEQFSDVADRCRIHLSLVPFGGHGGAFSLQVGKRVAAHVGERGAAQAAVETQDAALAEQIELAARKVADLDRRLIQIGTAFEVAARRGRTNTALSAMEGQCKARAALANERNGVAAALG
jgi:hypothetical protein